MPRMLTRGMTSSESVEWGTPDRQFDPLNELYEFTLDGAASHTNAKVARYCTLNGTFYRISDPQNDPDVEGPWGASVKLDPRDGLAFPWAGERVFLNPPWGDGLPAFMRKTRDEYLRHRALVVAILPARTDTAWFHDFVLPYARIQWIRGRVKFLDPLTEERAAQGLPPREGPPVGAFVAVYR